MSTKKNITKCQLALGVVPSGSSYRQPIRTFQNFTIEIRERIDPPLMTKYGTYIMVIVLVADPLTTFQLHHRHHFDSLQSQEFVGAISASFFLTKT